MRRLAPFLLAAAAVGAFASAWGAPSSGAIIVGLSEAEARSLLERRTAASGLGVYPPSLEAGGFVEAFASSLRSRLGGEPGVGIDERAAQGDQAVLAEAFGTPQRIKAALASGVSVLVMHLADDVEAIVATDDRPVFVLGIGTTTPLLIGRLDVANPGVLAEGVARRRGIVTPDDLAVTVLGVLGIDGEGLPGEQLIVDPVGAPLAELDARAARMERDARFGPPLTKLTVGAGIASVVFGTLALALRRRRLGAAFVLAGGMVPAGYIGALFIQDGRWHVRAVVVLGAFVFGLLIPATGIRRACGWILLGTTFALAGIALVAAAAPDVEPATSLWGDPLNSWRFFGLRNHLAAFLAGGYLIGASLLAFPAWLLALGALAVGVVVGAPTLGANYIAVLTLAFGVSLIVLARAAGRVRLLHVPIAAVVGATGALVALAADAGSPVSHGGRAVGSIRSGGLEVVWDIFSRRARINARLVTDLGVIGGVALALLAFVLAYLLVWSLRASEASSIVRAGVGGVAAASIASLILEDSGFYVAGLLGLYAWVGFAADHADRLRASTSAPPIPTS